MRFFLLSEPALTRFLFFYPDAGCFAFEHVTETLNRENTFGRLLPQLLENAGRITHFFYADPCGCLGEFLPRTRQLTQLEGFEIKSAVFPIEWTFQKPDSVSIDRLLAMNAAFQLFPGENMVLVNLSRHPALDILQGTTHLGGTDMPWLECVVRGHFPESHHVLRPVIQKDPHFPQVTLRELALQSVFEGSFEKWRQFLREMYYRDTNPLFVTYGEDLQGIRLFRGVSDYHVDDLVEIGCRTLAFGCARQPA
jgi:hypothetical protein